MRNNEKKYTLYLEGRVGAVVAPFIREKLSAIPADTELVILDFSNVYYVASAGIREVLICLKKFRERLRIVNVSKEVYKIFKITGFHEMLNIELAPEGLKKTVYLSFKMLLDKLATEAADRAAFITDDRVYTWSDIDKLSQIRAAYYEDEGITEGVHVAIIGTNSISWIITFFALQKLGAMVMLLNAGMSADEIAVTAKVGDITHLCYGNCPAMGDEEAFKKQLLLDDCKLRYFYHFEIEKDMEGLSEQYEKVKNRCKTYVDPDFPSVMLFTSGSTGKPKGVLLSGYNLLNASDTFVHHLQMTDADRICLILPLFHIFSQITFLAGALSGAVTVLPKDIRTTTVLEIIEKEKCTIMNSVPTMLLALINNKEFRSDGIRTLRGTVIAGSAATPAQVELFQEKMPNNHFLGAYGLSEMAPVSMTKYDDTMEHITTTVGKPVKNIKIKIYNHAEQRECATGETGEILVQGYNLMIGYYKLKPDEQAIDEDGYLRSGDLGFLDEDGYLHLNGRSKELIIRGGENIMPLEVESAISSIPGVDMVRVFGMPDDFYGEEVCACIKMKDGAVFDEAKMRQILTRKLAKFKVPKYLLCYEELPILGSGKIDTVKQKKEAASRIGLCLKE